MSKNHKSKRSIASISYNIIMSISRYFRMVSRIPFMHAKSTNDKLKVGFIVQLPSIWDKQVDLYNELKKRPNVEVFLFGVPPYDFINHQITGDIDDYFLNTYPEIINLYKNGNVSHSLSNYHIDYLFYPRPYDHYLPKEIRSETLYRNTICCYIPYGMNGSDVFNEGNIINPFFDNISVLYMDSESQLQLMKKRYVFSEKLGRKKIQYLGYPALTRYLSFTLDPDETCITWTPRWSTDSVIGGSNFIGYKEDFLSLVETMNVKFIFRPHPLMFDELISKKIITEEYKNTYLEKLKMYNVEYDISSPIDIILNKTSLLITDFSSIIPMFFLTGRPIIYCDGGIPLNDTYKEMIDFNYYAKSWSDIRDFVQKITANDDYRRMQRLDFINNNYSTIGDSAIRIADDLIGGR